MVRWADPDRIAGAVDDYADRLREEHTGVRAVYWYGSWVSGTPTPSSDVDLCVVVEADERNARDRLSDYLPSRFPVGVDLVVFTERELSELAERAPAWHRAIVSGRKV